MSNTSLQRGTVDFHGHALTVITGPEGEHLVAMKPICEAIGLQWEAQLKRIKRHPVLSQGMSIMDTPSAGGYQETTCLPLDYLNGWLFGVDASRVRPEISERLVQYQRECFAALAAYWQQGEAVNPRAALGDAAAEPVVVASKPFGESYLLAEMFAQLLEAHGIAVQRRPGLGATEIAFSALREGAIDVYPEYTGTGLLAVLHDTLSPALAADRRAVYDHVARVFAERWGMRWLPPLGFENTYAIAVRPEVAAKYHLTSLSDLAREGPHLVAGFTADFIGRPDGLAGLARVYGLHPREVRPLAPAIKYQALAAGAVDVIDGYSTDGLLERYHLMVLQDDRHFFPPYQAAALVGARLARTRPDAVAALTLLSNRLNEMQMRALNQRVEVRGEDVGTLVGTLKPQQQEA